MKKIQIVMIALFTMLLIGCRGTPPARNYNFDLPPGYSMEQIERAIIKAAEGRSWEIKSSNNGLITGKIITYDNTAEIRIPYSTSGYSIQYVGSQNLKGDASRIPENYNRWAIKLSQSVRQQLNY
jgi:hypothetical protein